jgi:hypothetical protein
VFVGKETNVFDGVVKWDKESHLERMLESKLFKYCREIVLQNEDQGDAKRLVGLALSQG